ncbi:unnamed protein product [Effrenium voratum]|nr:unnamed protein product [Effrenium voratum]
MSLTARRVRHRLGHPRHLRCTWTWSFDKFMHTDGPTCASPRLTSAAIGCKLNQLPGNFQLEKEEGSIQCLDNWQPMLTVSLSSQLSPRSWLTTLHRPWQSRWAASSCSRQLPGYIGKGYLMSFGACKVERGKCQVPPLFGVAGLLISTLYWLIDDALEIPESQRSPSGVQTLTAVACFAANYVASGLLSSGNVDVGIIAAILAAWAVLAWRVFDGTTTGLLVSVMTAVGGTLIEVFLINAPWWDLYAYAKADCFNTSAQAHTLRARPCVLHQCILARRLRLNELHEAVASQDAKLDCAERGAEINTPVTGAHLPALRL